MSTPFPYVYQIHVSSGGVPKHAVTEAYIERQGLRGDRQTNTRFHGGPDRAVCLFSLELVEALRAEGHPMAAGASGENLTLAGLDWPVLVPGTRVKIGGIVRLEVSSYTVPCAANARWFTHGAYTRISQKHYPGWSRLYARVLTEGLVRAGDAVAIETNDSPTELSR